jgi:hypothetical protein
VGLVAGSALVVDETLNPLYSLWAPVDEPHLGRARFWGDSDRRMRILADWDLWIALVRDAQPALSVEPFAP